MEKISNSLKGKKKSPEELNKRIFTKMSKRISTDDFDIICNNNYLIKDIAKRYKMCNKTVVKIRNNKKFYLDIWGKYN